MRREPDSQGDGDPGVRVTRLPRRLRAERALRVDPRCDQGPGADRPQNEQLRNRRFARLQAGPSGHLRRR